ncbi:fatty acid cis/trans isomerase [Vibrio vulnificus]|nr:fatty acid cis/trans isomerase [Vibrio vulnificus]
MRPSHQSHLGHQLLSRLYMDFLRMEGESGFLLLLPELARNNAHLNMTSMFGEQKNRIPEEGRLLVLR